MLYISDDAKEIITKEILLVKWIETGGMLFGYKQGDNVLVTDCCGPGPKAKKSIFDFMRDHVYCEEFFYHLQPQRDLGFMYLGEWHLHVFSSQMPSRRDNDSMFGIAAEPNYQNSNPILIIATYEMFWTRKGVNLKAFRYSNKTQKREEILIRRMAEYHKTN